MSNKFLSTTAKSTFILTWLIFITSCANPIAPTGGPKDEVAPLLLDSLSYPNINNNTNRTGSNIYLVFNETTEVSALKGQLISTPLIDTKLIKYKTKKVHLRDTSGKPYKGTSISLDLNQDLDSNTTYVLNFGSAFKDINEGKTATNISIAFSTGSIIDSLKVIGKVKVNSTGAMAQETMVALYQVNDTSNATNTLPKYYTNTSDDGTFELNYIKAGSYRLASFTDNNKNNKYDPLAEKIAYHPNAINLDSLYNAKTLLLFKEDYRQPTINKIESFNNLARITFNKPLQKIAITNYNDKFIKTDISRKKVTVYKQFVTDTLISLSITDSIDQTTDTTISLRFDTLKIRNQKTTQHAINQYINKNFTQIISFSNPIFETHLDSTSLYATNRSYHLDSITEFSWNSNNTELSISASLPKYHDTLYFQNLNFISVIGDTIQKSTTLVRTDSGKFGSLFFTVQSSEPNYIIDLFDKDKKLISSTTNPSELSLVNFKPQDIYVRILIDKNNNGRYDTGSYLNNIQTEEYIYLPDPYTVKAGWDIEDIKIVVGKSDK